MPDLHLSTAYGRAGQGTAVQGQPVIASQQLPAGLTGTGLQNYIAAGFVKQEDADVIEGKAFLDKLHGRLHQLFLGQDVTGGGGHLSRRLQP